MKHKFVIDKLNVTLKHHYLKKNEKIFWDIKIITVTSCELDKEGSPDFYF